MMFLPLTGSTRPKSQGQHRADRRSLGLGVSPMTANQERPAGDGQTGPLHELSAARVPWPWVHNSSPFDRSQVTNHTIICPTAPFVVVPKPAPGRTRGEEGKSSHARWVDCWMGCLRRQGAGGALRSSSHWPLALVGSVKNLGNLATLRNAFQAPGGVIDARDLGLLCRGPLHFIGA